MESLVNVINKLNDFRNRDKLSNERWEERGLNPSDRELCRKMNLIFDEITINLIDLINLNHSERQLKAVLKAGIKKFDKSEYDTEEKEFICDLVIELADIINVDIKDELNKWLYGYVLNIAQKLSKVINPEKIISTLGQPCNKCGVQLVTQIKKKQEGIPDSSWPIGKCDNCDELNLIALEPGIKELKFSNYKWVQSLHKVEYNREQALAKLEQIKFFEK